MALVLICGLPCSGKSTAAACLLKALEDNPFPVKLIDEPSLNLERNQSYSNMSSEKNLRGLLRSEVDRSVSKEHIIVVDSLNSIKGYRYELWCLARAIGVKYCLLYCHVEESICQSWNKLRQELGNPSYEGEIFEDLVRRFEEPDKRNRWDSPFFELKPTEDEISESSTTILEAVAFLRGRSDSNRTNAQILQPTIATQSERKSGTNKLYELDQATQEVITALVEVQGRGAGGNVGRVHIGEHIPNIVLQRTVGLPELRRLRRTFIKLAGQSSLSGPPPPSDSESAKRMFADYLNQELSSS